MDKVSYLAGKFSKLSIKRAMNRYCDEDYATQLKVRFVYFLILSEMIALFVIILLTAYLQKYIQAKSINWFIIVPETILLICFFLSFIILIKGYFRIASHSILILSFITIWLVMFFDKSDTFSVLDTILFVPVIISTTSIIVRKKKHLIFLYSLFNLIIFFAFVYVFNLKYNGPKGIISDFLIDGTSAIAFGGLVAFHNFRINREALDKAQEDIQNRKKVEQSLLVSEKKYREMTEFLPQTVFECDLNGRLNYVNKFGLEKFGYTSSDIEAGLNIFKTIHPSDLNKAKENIQRIIENSTVSNNQYKAINREGEIIHVHIYTTIIRENEINLGLRGVLIDISAEVKSSLEIKQSRDQFQSLVDNIPGITYRCRYDKNWTMLFMSSEVDRISGYPSAEFINNNIRTYASVIHGEDIQYVTKAVDEAIKENRSWEIEYRILHKDGSIRWAYERGKAIKDNEGQIEFLDGFILDFTQKKLSDQALIESENKYKDLFLNAPVPLATVNAKGEMTGINNLFTSTLGYLIDDIKTIEQWWSKAYPDENYRSNVKNIWETEFNKAIANQTNLKALEYNVCDKFGNQLVMLIGATIHQDTVLAGFIDITEKKKTETELEKYRENLEILVRERTEELETANEELKSVNEELNDKNKIINNQNTELKTTLQNLQDAQTQLVQSEKMASLGILTAGIAHEINNPLNFIMGGCTGLEEHFNDFDQNQNKNVAFFIDCIKNGVGRAAEIVSSLNQFSRDKGTYDEIAAIHSIIDNCLVILNNNIKSRIEVEKYYCEESISIIGNVGKLHQVFINILNNSLHAIGNKGIIKISTKKTTENVLIEIFDSGHGISKENLTKITDPFFTTKEPGEGTGLGLSISYNIIREHKGTISFDSEPNKGTTVLITFPIKY